MFAALTFPSFLHPFPQPWWHRRPEPDQHVPGVYWRGYRWPAEDSSDLGRRIWFLVLSLEEHQEIILELETKVQTCAGSPEDPCKSWRNAEKVSTRPLVATIRQILQELFLLQKVYWAFPCCRRFTFCAQDPAKTEISPGESITYVKCRDGWEVKPRKRWEAQEHVWCLLYHLL